LTLLWRFFSNRLQNPFSGLIKISFSWVRCPFPLAFYRSEFVFSRISFRKFWPRRSPDSLGRDGLPDFSLAPASPSCCVFPFFPPTSRSAARFNDLYLRSDFPAFLRAGQPTFPLQSFFSSIVVFSFSPFCTSSFPWCYLILPSGEYLRGSSRPSSVHTTWPVFSFLCIRCRGLLLGLSDSGLLGRLCFSQRNPLFKAPSSL